MNNTPRYTIAHIPFLRLLLPLAIGIVCGHYTACVGGIYVCAFVATAGGVVAWMTRHNRLKRLHHWAFFTSATMAMAGLGMFVYMHSQPDEELPCTTSSTVAIARIEDAPIKKQYSYQVNATIIAMDDSSCTHTAHIPVLLNIKHSYTADGLLAGDIIMFLPRLQRIESSALPDAFDYAQYMKMQGVVFRQYLADGEWQQSAYTATPTLRQRAQRVQAGCVESLRNSGLSTENIALLSALLWGDKTNLPATTREYFSAAGLSHVLAVSGLHTGIIALIISCLLYPLRYTGLRKLPYALTIATLWVYAFITGLSPSVVRACIMATFVGTAVLINRRNTALNALCASAVCVLLFDPMQLFDIGFQLSYVAVAGILLFSPYFDLARILDIRNFIARAILQSVSVSTAAMIATTPIAAYYFHYIPVWGLLSNIIFVPLLPYLVVATLALQLCCAFHWPHQWLLQATDRLTQILTDGANFIAGLPSATIDGIWLSPLFLILYFAITICLWHILSRRTLRPCLPLLILFITLQILLIYQSAKPSASLAFVAQERNYTHLQLADNARHCYIISTDTTSALPRQGEEWRIREQLHTNIVNRNDTVRTTHIYIALPFIQYYDSRLLWVDDNEWRYTHTSQPIHIDYAIITEQYKGKIKPLTATFDIDTIILAASIFPPKAKQLRQECATIGIGCYDTGEADVWLYKPNSD